MPLTLSSAMADRFSQIIALLYEIIAEHGVRQLRDGRLTIMIYNRIHFLSRRFLARATVPPRREAATPRSPRPQAAGSPVAPRPRPKATDMPATGPADGAPLPRGRAWLIRLMQPTAVVLPQLIALLHEPEVTALLLARPQLARLLRPLCHALSMPPMPWFPPVRRRPPEPGPANPGAGTAAAPAGPAPGAKPPGRRDQRPLPWHRNEDLACRLPIGPPLPGS